MHHCRAEAPVQRLTASCCCVDGAPTAEVSETIRPPVKLENSALAAEAPAVIASAPDGAIELRRTDFGIDRSPPPSFERPLRI